MERLCGHVRLHSAVLIKGIFVAVQMTGDSGVCGPDTKRAPATVLTMRSPPPIIAITTTHWRGSGGGRRTPSRPLRSRRSPCADSFTPSRSGTCGWCRSSCAGSCRRRNFASRTELTRSAAPRLPCTSLASRAFSDRVHCCNTLLVYCLECSICLAFAL